MEDQTADTVRCKADVVDIPGGTLVGIVLFETQHLHPNGGFFHGIRLLFCHYISSINKIKTQNENNVIVIDKRISLV